MVGRRTFLWRIGLWSGLALAGLLLGGTTVRAQISVDPNLPDYQPVPGVSGTIKSVGSDTMNNEMTLWAEGFKRFYPAVMIEVEGKGSATAPPALIEGSATFGPMSREMKPSEIDAFEERYGYPPTAIATGIDMLAVYTHQDNPLTGLTMAEVDAIFSRSRKLGHSEDITNWGQLGLDGDWSTGPISLYGRNSASGTYGFFKDLALGKGDFKDSVKEQPGSSSVVQSIAKDRFAIGYSGIGYKTADVNALPLADDKDSGYVEPTLENAYSGEYPLTRFLLLYVNIRPGTRLDPLRAEFLRFVLSKQGQEIVIKDGYFPIPAPLAERMLREAGLEP